MKKPDILFHGIHIIVFNTMFNKIQILQKKSRKSLILVSLFGIITNLPKYHIYKVRKREAFS